MIRRTAYPLTMVLVTMVALLFAGSAQGFDCRFSVELEGGPAWQTKNDLQIPNDDSATRFSLVDLVGKEPAAVGRVYLTWNINRHHGVRALIAPFQIVESGTTESDIAFARETFAADTPIEATYKFNSWRLSYLYRLLDGTRSRWWIGFTAKIRDAKVELRQGNLTATDTDVGFVPLLHVSGEFELTPRLRVLLDADALAGGPGRAIDASAKLGYDLSRAWRFTLGYRTLEGGADVDAVYNFTWLHYGVASLVWRYQG